MVGIRFGRFLTQCSMAPFLVLGLCLILNTPGEQAFAGGAPLVADSPDPKFEAWVKQEAERSWTALFRNISPLGAARGAVVASPSKVYPDYFFHWVRDAALVMDGVVTLYQRVSDPRDRTFLKGILADFVRFSRGNQLTPNLSGGLGEPKFGADGAPFQYEWGRPQNDGPALRAIALIRFSWEMLIDGKTSETWVREKLYDSDLPSYSLIKNDLEYVSHHWMEPSFDLWEEIFGDHFYTRMVQRRALLDGAALADHLGDPGAADWYRIQARLLEREILRHWDAEAGQIQTTLKARNSKGKTSNLDVAVILGVLHGSLEDGFFSVSDERVLATAQRLEDVFAEKYEINQDRSLGTAIGRYPEDVYDGYLVGKNTGNPWVLSTTGFAELYFRLERTYAESKKILISPVNLPFFTALLGPRVPLHPGETLYKGNPLYSIILKELLKKGDSFLRRVQAHTPSDGGLSEQINRLTGFMQGAYDLSWSYGSYLTAFWARAKAMPEFRERSEPSKPQCLRYR